MIRTPVSFGSFSFSTGYTARLMDFDNQARDLDVDINLIPRAGTTPSLGSKNIKEKLYIVTLEVAETDDESYEAVALGMDSTNETEQALVATDEAGRQWYVMAVLSRPPLMTAPRVWKLVFMAADGIWKSVDEVEETWLVTASGDDVTLTNSGTRDAHPVLEITPTVAKTGGFFYRKWIPAYNPITTLEQNDAVDLTAGGLDTAALVTASKMQADGDDWRVFVDGAEVDRWLEDMNDTDSKCWVNLRLQPGVEMTLKYDLDNTSPYPAIDIPTSSANLAALKKLQAATNKVFIVVTGANYEAFTYTGVNLAEYDITGVTRAQKGTSKIAHSAGDKVIWIEHDIWMAYGNAALEAPETNDDTKPVFDMSASTQASRVYAAMSAQSLLRMGSFVPAVLSSSGKLSTLYTGNQGADADPATELGLSIRGWTKAGVWQAESAILEWRYYHPAEITHVSSEGEKYRHSTSWPTAALQKSANGTSWSSQWTQATPAALQTWEDWTKNAEALGAGIRYIRFLSSGSIVSAASNEATWEVEDVTLTLNSAKVIQVLASSEQENYELDVVLSNGETGEMIRLTWRMGLNTTLTVDTAEGTVEYEDGTNAYNALSRPAGQVDWLRLVPGENEITYTDVGTAGVTVDITYEERTTP